MKNYRVYVEKKPRFRVEAESLRRELNANLGLELQNLRLLNVYDLFGFGEELLERSRYAVFGETVTDTVTDTCDLSGHKYLAVEFLPGQFDQRAASAVDCVRLIDPAADVRIRSSKLLLFDATVSDEELARIRHYYVNAVESREKNLGVLSETEQPEVSPVEVLTGFRELTDDRLAARCKEWGLAMNADDLQEVVRYFREEGRDPYETELRILDTYWSDHCRHTTFTTELTGITVEESFLKDELEDSLALYLRIRRELGREHKSLCLMDLATIGARWLRKEGLLDDLETSDENNACSVYVDVEADGTTERWLLQFKNETHNHPTEIEPFGGASTCLGGAIRDPLSGRSYVYQAMRVTGAGDIYRKVSETLPGKLPQSVISKKAAAGYSSYGNQIGLATTHVREIYHPGYVAKRLEVGAVAGAVKAENVRRERPEPGDRIVMLGGRTGRDGIGGATGSSKEHDSHSLETCGSEVQKGNAPEERKLERLFRRPEVTRLIKKSNDFGAGGVSVAIGELADGLEIDLDAVRKKYDGLDGTELAISESQERMAVVVSPEDEEQFIAMAQAENLEAYRVAVVTESPRMVMTWKGQTIADLSREFLNTNGAVKRAKVSVPERNYSVVGHDFSNLREMAASLKCASRRGLVERFDGSIGAGSVLMPFGGKTQTTPAQAMAALLPTMPGEETDQASVMAYGCNPEWLSADPFAGARASVTLSLAKLVAAGADYKDAYLTLQEFFEKLRNEPERWGKPFSALLGALDAQLDYGAAAIGGKDSMSGSFLDLDVPPTLISFAIAPVKAGDVLSPEFKEAGRPVYVFAGSQKDQTAWDAFHKLAQGGKVKAAWAVEHSVAEGLMNMSFGNRIGFTADPELELLWYAPAQGSIVAELTEDVDIPNTVRLGVTTEEPVVTLYHNGDLPPQHLKGEDSAPIGELLKLNEAVLEEVYPTRAGTSETVEAVTWDRRSPAVFDGEIARPRVVIPVFPGTNCEYDSVRACLRAGMDAETVVIRNLTPQALADSALELERAIKNAQIVFLPGGFSGGDEPEGSAKLIMSLFRNPRLTDAVHDLLKRRDGLMLGICNGFQALLKLGLVSYGEIRPAAQDSPTLTYNLIGRHQSRYVTTRVASVKSPWMLLSHVGELHTIPVSNGEGRFVAPQGVLDSLAANGQIATQYVDAQGASSMDITVNPNGSMLAIEGIFSPDGRVFGKMGHSERRGRFVAKNIPGDKFQPIFDSGALYFR